MGAPLASVPAPEGSAEASYARAFMKPYLGTFAGLGIRPTVYWMSDLYAVGVMDGFIRTAIERADRVVDLYRRVSKVERPKGWLPVSVICEQCGKVGTTNATDWDGETVRYQCLPEFVTWAHGCGREGRIAPFGGRAKLPWNLEWAAQWSHFGVTIEGCGKDLATAGGSRDRSDAIAREVFDREPPRNVPYEFLNVGGRKMSTSRGRGAAAHTIAEVVPPEQLRFLFLRPRPNQVIEFDPDGSDAIPRLFDEFDRIAAATAGLEVKGELPPNPRRVLALSLVAADADVAAEAALFRPAFGHLALLVQVPGVNVAERMAVEKGEPLLPREEQILDERVAAARAWLETYAPDRARIAVQATLPDMVRELGEDQRIYLGALELAAATVNPTTGTDWQDLLFSVAATAQLPQGRAFGAIYVAFLGRTNGPRAGWLLAGLEPSFVLARLREAAGWRAAEADAAAADAAGRGGGRA